MHDTVQLEPKSPQATATKMKELTHNSEKEENNLVMDIHQPGKKEGADSEQSLKGNKSSDSHLATSAEKLSFSFNNIPVHKSKPASIQPKLLVNTPGDEYEQEAEAVTDKIMRMQDTEIPQLKLSRSNIIHRKCETCGKEEMEEENKNEGDLTGQLTIIQRKCVKCEEEETLQRKESAGNAPALSYIVNQTLQSSGQPLDTATRSFMEPRFGYDFSKVRIHDDPVAHRGAKDINALAYTHQHNIVFARGRYQPKTKEGRQLLAHELTHVIQQNGETQNIPNLIQRMPGPDCTPDAIRSFVQNMHDTWCDKPRSCSLQGDTCASATAKVAAGYGCVDARTVLQQKCFSPGAPLYETHMQQIAEASQALRNCLEVMRNRCTLEVGLAAAAAAVAIAVAKGAKSALRSGVAKALIYAEAAAAILLLLSGKAEAKISLDGDSALESLYKAMEQEGTPVPDELKAMIESEPDLKAMIEDSAKKSGKLSDVQKEIAKKYAEFISKHMNEFSKEELEQLMASTDSIGTGASDPSVDALKKALKQKSDQKGALDSQPGAGQDPGLGTDAGTVTKDGADKTTPPIPKDSSTGPVPTADPKDKADSKYEGLSPENKDKIKSAAPPVYKLFQKFTSGDEGGVKLNDDLAKRFFEIIPGDLTQEQSDALMGRLTSSKGKTADEIIDHLRKGVEEIRKTPKDGDAGTTGTDSKDSNDAAVSKEETIKDLMQKAKDYDFKHLSKGSAEIASILKKVAQRKFSTYVYVKQDKIGIVGIATYQIPASTDVSKLKKGSVIEVIILSQGPFVDKDGREYTNIKLGNRITVV